MGIYVIVLLEVKFTYLCQRTKILLSLHRRFTCVRHRYVSNSVVEETILTLVLEEHFPEAESLTNHRKKALLVVMC